MSKILHRLLILALIFAYLAPSASAAIDTSQLPDLGDESAVVIPPSQERKLGEDVMREARRTLKFDDDPELVDYIQTLGERLVAHIDYPYHDFQFFVVDDPSINAFAVPGGFIAVNTGLILAAENEAQLASVLAHEAAHISQRHIPRILSAQRRTTGASLAAILAAVVLVSTGQVQAGEAAFALSTAAAAQSQLNFTRAHEEEADRVGIRILTAAGYDARAMPEFFQRLQNWSRLYETNLPEFLRTHPITTNRIAESQDRAAHYPSAPPVDNTEFDHIRAKIRVASAPTPAAAVNTFKAELKDGTQKDKDAERYGYALALLADQQYQPAREQARALIARHPQRTRYRVLAADIDMAARQYSNALSVYAAAYKLDSQNRALIHRYADALVKTGTPRTAVTILRDAVKRYPRDPGLYKLLATATGETGDRYAAHSALAEHYVLNGDLHGAVKQLEIAARFTGDSNYLQARNEARLKELKDEIARAE